MVGSVRSRSLLAAAAIAVFLSAGATSEAFAGERGRGLSDEERAFMRSLSNQERDEIRSMGRRERRDYIRRLMAKPRASESRSDEAPIRENAVPDSAAFAGLEGFVPPDAISQEVRLMVGKVRGRGSMADAVAIQRARGGIETGLEPAFIGGAACPEIDSEKWAIDYSHKRPWPAIHKGIDIPQPRGTPIRAVADGTVVGKFENAGNRKGIEVMLRHTPDQTGLPFWTYSQYTHLQEMSPLVVGATVRMGQEIGRTANTGKMGRRIRRDALHFAILYSRSPEWSNEGRFVIPKDSYWMDPNAFYRVEAPWDSQSLAALPDERKKVPIPHMKRDGSFLTPETKRIWPYACD